MDVMRQNPDAVVITQVGGFYEMYFEHALKYGPPLNLRVTRKRQLSPNPNFEHVYMAGFPLEQLDRYAKQLVVSLRKRVVLLEQNPDQVLQGGSEIEKRPITRILTPGTLLNETMVDATSNNYLASVYFSSDSSAEQFSLMAPVVVAWVDIGAGEIMFEETSIMELPQVLSRVSPRELLLDNSMKKIIDEFEKMSPENKYDALAQIELKRFPITYISFPQGSLMKTRYSLWFTASADEVSYAFDVMDRRVSKTCAALLYYIETTLPGDKMIFEFPKKFEAKNQLSMDRRTRLALEIFQTSTPSGLSTRGSLMSVVQHTVTPPGTRLLQRWLSVPLTKRSDINKRLDLVQLLINDRVFAESLKAIFRSQPDGPRLLQKIALQRHEPSTLVDYAKILDGLQSILEEILSRNEPVLEAWKQKLEFALQGTIGLSKKIRKIFLSADVEASSIGGYTPLLKYGASKKLDILYASQRDFEAQKEKILQRIHATYPSAVLLWSPKLGYHVHVKLNGSKALPGLVLSRSKTYACFVDADWTELGRSRDLFRDQIMEEERRILLHIRKSILKLAGRARVGFQILAEMDVLQSLSELALNRRLVRPILIDEPVLNIEAGRHLQVETGLQLNGQNFEANDVLLIGNKRTCMITGPNMGGKSTYLRQAAIICLLAHIGSFVPASMAIVGTVDRIFCRVGAGDDLYRGRSTFMVEMLETATILKHASPRSLAVLDEVGRGTSGTDGLSIAYAAVKYLVEVNKCRALFATHFGPALWTLLRKTAAASYITCLTAEYQTEKQCASSNHKLKPGICDNSQGIAVAALAGFPSNALADARKVNLELSRKNII